jgi:hypothetical protein
MKTRLLSFVTILILAHTVDAERRAIICKTPAIADSCYKTHGRLGVYNGTPSWRLWEIGTTHELSIFSGPAGYACDMRGSCLDNESPHLPPQLQRAFDSVQNPIYEITVFADFEVCPLEPHTEGHMQAACIESAKHLVVIKD